MEDIKEKTADELFKKCGFNKIGVYDKLTGEEYPHCTEYVKWDGTWEEQIHFNNSTKLMTTSCELFGKATIGMMFYPELLQAINKKCKELRLVRR
jgi:hypothetical protein